MATINSFISYIKENKKLITLSTIVIFIVSVGGHLIFPLSGTDFAIYLAVAKDWLANGFTNTYNYAFWVARVKLPFRYLPFFVIIMSPLGAMPLIWGYFTYFVINIFLLIVCGYLIKNILALLHCDYKPGSRLKIVVDFLIYIALPMETLYWGQVSIILGTILLLSFYYFLKGKQMLGSFFLGLTFVFKPIMFTLALLILFGLGWKGFIKRMVCMVLPLVPDAIILALNKPAFQGFVNLNIIGFIQNSGKFHAISFMNVLSIAGISSVLTEGVAIVACTLAGIFLAKRQANRNDKLLTMFTVGVVSYIIAFSEVWTNQAFYIYMFLALYIARFMQNKRSSIVILLVYTLLMFVKLYLFDATAYSLNGISPEFEAMPWQDALAIIAASPMLVFDMILSIITCTLSVPIFIALFFPETKDIDNSVHQPDKNIINQQH